MKRKIVTISEFESDLKNISPENFSELNINWTCTASVDYGNGKTKQIILKKKGTQKQINDYIEKRGGRKRINVLFGIAE